MSSSADKKNCPTCFSTHLAVECPSVEVDDACDLTAGERKVMAGLVVQATKKVLARMAKHPFTPEPGKRDVNLLKLATYKSVYRKMTGEDLPI